LGGLNITKDISSILGINLTTAEKIKILNNTILLSPIEEQEVIKYRNLEMLQEITNKLPTRVELSAIIQARLEEIFETLLNNLQSAKISLEIISNIVIIGGVSQTLGIDKLAKQIYQKNTRIGYSIKPNNIPADFHNIVNTTALGMLTAMQNEFIKYQGITPENNESWLKKILNKFIKE
jgi:cell division protein FtsA